MAVAPNKDLEFLPPQQSQSTPLGRQSIEKSTYLQLAILLGVALLIAALVYAFMVVMQNRSIQEQKNSGSSQIDNQTNQLSQIEQQSKQDQQRKNDVATINSALKSFFLKEKRLPDSLKELVPDYLAQMPTDPATQKEYSYKPSPDKKSWSVTAILSDGTTFKANGP
jgi:Tfp pilus assembly protein PilN